MKQTLRKKGFILTIVLAVAATVVLFFPKKKHSMDWILSYELKDGTQSMVQLLEEVNTWTEDHQELARRPTLARRVVNLFHVAPRFAMYEGIYQLKDGNTQKAIDILSKLSITDWDVGSSDASFQTMIHEWLAISYIRLGEEENCILDHNGNSCILPIHGTGIYEIRDPTLKALEIYKHLLSKYPENYRYRWLLNLAYQTLGEYPEKVPDEWLINPEAFKDLDPADNFKNIAPQLGVDHNSLAGGACMEDFNNDGNLDIMVSGRKRTQLTLYMNDGSGSFTNRTEEAGLSGLTGGFNLFQADYNNDGDTDIFVVRGAWLLDNGRSPNSLLKNNGDGTFTDVTVSAGLLSFKPTLNAVWADFNNDGWLDLFVGNETRKGFGKYSSEFYLNNQDGSFSEVSESVGLGVSCFVKGLSVGDYNNDGWTDLFISNKEGPNFLFKNQGVSESGELSFTDVSTQAGVTDPKYSFTSWFWDYDNDGDEDLYVSVYEGRDEGSVEKVAASYDGQVINSVWPVVYQNNGNGTFTSQTEALNLTVPLYTMGANYADFDNDGFLDIYLGTGEPNYMGIYPNRMFYNRKAASFEDVTSEKGVGHIQKGHGVAIGDIDNDGDQDILAQMGGMLYGDKFQNALFQNPGGTENQWITLILEGKDANRSAIGAKVRLVVNTNSGTRNIYRSVSSGGSFGANSLQLEIGLGNTHSIDTVEVKWPGSQSTQIFTSVKANQSYKIIQDHSQLENLPLRKILFDETDGKQQEHQHD